MPQTMHRATDFTALEDIMEIQRLDGNWQAVRMNLKEFSSIIDLTADSTSFHPDISSMKAYYWCCMTEMTFYLDHDLGSAVGSLQRAVAVCPHFPDIRPIAVRVLLYSCNELIKRSFSGTGRPTRVVERVKLDALADRQTLTGLLGSRYQELPGNAKAVIQRISSRQYLSEMVTLTAVLACLPADDLVAVCADFSHLVSEPIDKLPACLVLSACCSLLAPISLQGCAEKAINKALSPYSYWLLLDAQLTHSLLCDMLGDLQTAVKSMENVLQHISMDQLAAIPTICGQQVLQAACRLPALASRRGSMQMDFYDACIQPAGRWHPFLPAQVVAMLTIELAVGLVDCCRRSGDSAHLLTAFHTLQAWMQALQTPDEALVAMASAKGHLESLQPLPGSNLRLFASSDALQSADLLAAGTIPALIAGITVHMYNHHDVVLFKEQSLEAEVLRLLQWGCDAEVAPRPAMLWLLGNAYYRTNRLSDAMDALPRAHKCIVRQMSRLTAEVPLASFITSIDEHLVEDQLLEWLGLPRPVSLHPHAPLSLFVDIALHVDSANISSSSSRARLQELQDLLQAAIKTCFGSHAEQWSNQVYLHESIEQITAGTYPHPLTKRRLSEGLGQKYALTFADLIDSIPQLVLLPDNAQLPAVDLLSALCRVYVAQSRRAEVCEEMAFMLRYQAARICHMVLEYADIQLAEGDTRLELIDVMATMSLQFAVLLAELRLIPDAQQVVREVISYPHGQRSQHWAALESRYLHLLVLLVTAGSDDPKAFAMASALAQRICQQHSETSWNLAFTCILLALQSAESKAAGQLSQQLMTEMRDKLNHHSQPAAVGQITGFRPANALSTAITVFVGLARVFTKLQRYSLAKVALSEAWQALHGISAELAARMASMDDNKHDQMDTLRYLPTLLGWRLPDGCGWAHDHDVFMEAEVLCSCARILQLEGDDTKALEAYSHAIAICPQHVRSLTALALIYMDKGQEEAMAMAQYFIKAALAHKERDAQEWQAYALIASAAGANDTLEAELTAAECMQGMPLRSFDAVLCLLPTDLQIDILSVWLDCGDGGCSLIRVLAALDIACSKMQRILYHTLLSQLPPFGEYCPTSKLMATYRMLECMQWLGSRRVAVKSLQLCDVHQRSPAVSLPSIDTIAWKQDYAVSASALEAVLRSCPNATSLICSDLSLVTTLDAAACAPRLRALSMTWTALPQMGLLRALCPQLQELRLMRCFLDRDLADMLCSSCPLLQALEAYERGGSWISLLKIVQSCPLLREIVMHDVVISEDLTMPLFRISAVLASKQIKTLMIDTASGYSNSCRLLAGLLELQPDLEHLRVDDCWYSAGGTLRLSRGSLDTTVIVTLLTLGSSVHALDIECIDLQVDVAKVIADRMAGRLVSLACCSSSKEALEMSLGACRLLQCFDVYGTAVSDALLEVLSRSCPCLESLVLVPYSADSITDQGMIALFAGCRHLKELTLKLTNQLTVRTLQAIVSHKLRLRRLVWFGCDFKETDVIWLRESILEHQLLPMLQIVELE